MTDHRSEPHEYVSVHNHQGCGVCGYGIGAAVHNGSEIARAKTRTLEMFTPQELLQEAGRRIGASVKTAFGVPTYMNPIKEERENTPLPNGGIYIASRTKYAELWKSLRCAGAPIISSWIDATPRRLSDEGQMPGRILTPEQYATLWTRVVAEVQRADVLILFYQPSDEYLKGALVEVGVALAANIPVIYVGDVSAAFSFLRHPLVQCISTLDSAVEMALEFIGDKFAAVAEPPAPTKGDSICPNCKRSVSCSHYVDAVGEDGMFVCEKAAQCSGSCGAMGDDPDCPVHGESRV